jgi:hypothetical protein
LSTTGATEDIKSFDIINLIVQYALYHLVSSAVTTSSIGSSEVLVVWKAVTLSSLNHAWLSTIVTFFMSAAAVPPIGRKSTVTLLIELTHHVQ